LSYRHKFEIPNPRFQAPIKMVVWVWALGFGTS
jgi:hypothetical protein